MRRCSALQEGRSYLVDVPVERYGKVDGRVKPTTDYGAVAELDALTICVPTPLSKTRTPDLSYIVSAAESVAAHLRHGQLVVLQSTTYPGTTEEVVLPILESAGGRVGRDFFLGYAPERVDPGNDRVHDQEHAEADRGRDRRVPPAHRAPVQRDRRHDRPVLVARRVAETAKIHENTFRAVNIALANELALMCDKLGISAWEVIEAAATKPFAFLTHYPGPGLGGDCIPIVPHYLAWRLREYGYSAQMIEAAHEVNARMPIYVVQKVGDALNDVGRPIKGSKILLLGVAYKANVHDTRESPSFEVMRQLLARGGDVSYCDPWVPEFELDGVLHSSVEWSAERDRRGGLRRPPDAARRVPRAAALGRGAADRGHAERRPGRRRRQAHLEPALSSSERGTSGRSWRSLRSTRASRWCSRTTGTRRGASSSRGSRRAARASRPRTSAGRRTSRSCSRNGRARCSCSRRRRAARSPRASPTTRRRRT